MTFTSINFHPHEVLVNSTDAGTINLQPLTNNLGGLIIASTNRIRMKLVDAPSTLNNTV